MSGRIFFSLTFGFVLGILFSTYIPFSIGVVGFISVLIVLFLSSYFFTSRRGTYLLCAIVSLGMLLGVIRSSFVQTTLPAQFVPLVGTNISLSGKIVEDPDIRESSQRVTLEIEKNKEKTRILAVAPLFPKLSYGEEVKIEGSLEKPAPFDTNGGRVFRYDMFLAKDGIFAMVPRAFITVTKERSGITDTLWGYVLGTKHLFLDGISQALPEPESSLAAGLLVGGKQGLGEKLLTMFIATGLIHVVVLSGYNVMIVAEAVRKVFSVFPKLVANSLAGGTVLLFVLVSGAGSASIRAGLMAAVGLFARATGRTYDAVRALILAGVVMLLLNPLLLLNDPGFQLSFVATLGLILGTPIIERWLAFIKSDFLREIISSTVAAQVAVLPLLLYQTGLLSLVALPANILVLPVVPLAMATAAFAAVVGIILPFLAPLFALPSYALLYAMISITEFFASLPLASVTLPAFSILITLLVYVFLFFVWYKLRKQKPFSTQRHSN